MAETVTYPTSALRALVEETATDEGLSAAVRARELRLLRDDVTTLLGSLEQRLGEAELEVEAERLAQDEDHMRARENADLREELLRRGLADEETLDRLGYLSHDELDREVIEALDIREAAPGAWGLAKLRGQAFERKVRRARTGQFAEQPDASEVGKVIGGARVKRVLKDRKGRKHFVFDTPQTSSAEIASSIATGTAAPGLAPPARAQLQRRRGDEEDVNRSEEERKKARAERFTQRSQAMKGRVKREVRTGTREDRGTETAGLQAAGVVGQKRLLAYVRDAATEPTTADMHGRRQEDGTIVWDTDRAEVHAQIVDLLLRRRQVGPNGEVLRDDNGNPIYDPSGRPIPSQDEPQVLFTGGGYSAGKSSVLRSGQVQSHPGTNGVDYLTIDPDEIKAMLPEFRETLEADPEANLRVYEEAWAISQELQRTAQARGLNVVVDGISDSSPDEMLDRVQSFTDAGYKNPRAVYVDVPTDVALARAAKRAREATSPSDRRHIPEVIMRSVHRDVAATVPRLMEDPRARELGLAVQVYNTNQERGQPPLLIAERGHEDASFRVVDEDWGRFTAKAEEELPEVGEEEVIPFESAAISLPAAVADLRAAATQPPEGFEPGVLHHVSYFDLQPGRSKVIPTRALDLGDVDPEAAAAARDRLLEAAGGGDRLPVVAVRRTGNGRFEVTEGADVAAAAMDLGWADVPVVQEDEGGGALSPGLGSKPATDEALNRAVTTEEQRFPAQPVDPETGGDDLYAMAARYDAEFRTFIDEGVGLVDDLGGVTSRLEGEPRTPEFERTLARAKENVLGRMDDAQAIIGAIKSRAKAEGKVAGKYADRGDGSPYGWQKVQDLVRGTILVPSGDQLPQVVERLNDRARQRGWRIVEADNRYTDPGENPNAQGALPTGYADVSYTIEAPDGFKMELQINTTPMWLAKEVFGGHTAYDEGDGIVRAAKAAKRDLTAEERARVAELERRQRVLYAEARRRSFPDL